MNTAMLPGERVRGRTAVVTGAGNGLGRAIAAALVQAGARVVLVGRTRSKLEAVVAELAELGGSCRVACCDTSDRGQVSALGAELRSEEVSILVNNAGVAGPVAPLTDIEPDDWDAVFAVNVRGVFLMCREFLPAMVRRRTGDVVNLASVSGKRPLEGRTPYAASKMAVIGLTTTLAHEVGEAGVAVNTLSPGPVSGERMDRLFKLESERLGISVDEAEVRFVSRSALRRMVQESEVGAAVVAILCMTGLTGADVDLSAGMIGR